MLAKDLFILLGFIFQRFVYYYFNKQNTNSVEINHYNLKQVSQNGSPVFKDQVEYRKNIIKHQHLYSDVLKDINNNNHYLLWFKKSGIYNNPNAIIYILDINKKNSLNYLNKYCNKMKINLYIISECHPNEFIDKILINNEDIKININNYLSPYNFRYTFFGYLDKLRTYSDNKINISIEEILNYITLNINTNKNDYLLLTNNTNIKNNDIILID